MSPLTITSITSRRSRAFLSLLVLYYLFWTIFIAPGWYPYHGSGGDDNNDGIHRSRAMIIASMKKDDTSWYHEYFPDWDKKIYVVDDPEASYTVAVNKGREGNVYLTYIIDHYDELPEHMLFLHAERYQWHNDDPDYDGVPPINRLRLPYLEEQGYINLRCVHTLGCPVEIRPNTDVVREKIHAGAYFRDGFQELFPNKPVPIAVGTPCCAQFAVTRNQVRTRSREDYIRYRDWLLSTTLDDSLSGRIMEYSWHMIFGKDAIYCPPARECYCKQFGLCDLQCDDQFNMTCEGRYVLPPYASLPVGWPIHGWQGEVRPGFEREAERMKLAEQGTLIDS
ncbi:hypothetical protein KEM54_005024 [Ascosphaera aggregata]|nr:hypothetical protein KEM54_005024 [Ascosphaera aggregata]